MMALTINLMPCILVLCDGCSESLSEDATIHFDTFNAAAEAARAAEWLVRPDAVLCSNCTMAEDPPAGPEDWLTEQLGATLLPLAKPDHG